MITGRRVELSVARRGAKNSNQTIDLGLALACRVTTGRNRDGGRGWFCRFLAATSTHRYALTPNLFPVCSWSPTRFLTRKPSSGFEYRLRARPFDEPIARPA